MFYVEPIYLQAETAAYPELRLVVVMHGDDMSYGDSFDKALEKFFNASVATTNTVSQTGSTPTSMQENNTPYKGLIKQANEAFNNYLKYSGQKKFPDAANELEKLQDALNKLASDTSKIK